VTGAISHNAPASEASALVSASLDAVLADELRSIDAAGLRRTMRPVRRLGGARIVVGGREALDFASNDYLGLAADPRIARALAAGALDSGTGAGAARLITGTGSSHDRLERALAEHIGTEAALLFASGYSANAGIIPALVGEGDIIYSDQLAHASLIDGCRLSKAKVCIVPHGDLHALEALLQSNRSRARRSLIVTEGIYSMDGDRAPLEHLLSLARQYDAWLMLDDAHAFGVIGPQGRGSVAALGLQRGADITIGTLGKALGTAGAFVAGSRVLIEYLQHRARSFVFSTASSPALATATLTALHIARDEEWRRERLHENARSIRTRLRAHGLDAGGDPDSAIVPVPVGDPRLTVRVAARLERDGMIVGAIRPPTVPAGTSRLRITVSAAHEPEHLERLCTSLVAALVPDDS
jgi:8-amino-7-oxononanoate synthase